MSGYLDDYVRAEDSGIPHTMQALIAKGRGFENLEIAEVPVPEISPDQLLCRVDAAGVCTSIMKLIAQGPDHTFVNGWDMEKWPLILGDEGAVTVVKVGRNLRDSYDVGQRFALQPAVDVPPILHRERYSNNAAGMSKCAVGYTLGGNLAEYIRIQDEVLSGQCLLPLPDASMPYFAASMAEPISCVYSAQERSYHIVKESVHARRRPHMGLLPDGVTVVMGAGAMGRMHAEMALRFRPKAILVTDLQRERLDATKAAIGEKAKAAGTELHCVTADRLDETLDAVSNSLGADDIILAVGNQRVQQRALSLLARGGVANLFAGLPVGSHALEVDSRAVHYQEIKMVGSSGGDPSDIAATLNAISAAEIDPGNYVAAVGSLDNAIDVLRMIERTEISGKAILYPHITRTPLRMVEYWDAGSEKELLNDRLEPPVRSGM